MGVAASEWDEITEEQREVILWRVKVLTELGIKMPFSEMLAWASHVDVHKAVALKEAGATPEQIIKILL